MRQLIDGIVYDTDRAMLICVEGPYKINGWEGRVRVCHTLYRSEHGRFFKLIEYPSTWLMRVLGEADESYLFVSGEAEVQAMAWRCGIDLASIGIKKPEPA